MHSKRLNDELTIVGLILVLLFIVYHLINAHYQAAQLQTKLAEAQSWAIKLDSRLTTTEYQLEQTAESIEQLQTNLDEYRTIEPILKDIATSWDRRKN